MSDILNKILAVKADEVAAAKKHRDLYSLRREVETDAELRAACAASKPACAAASPRAAPA
jgi:indole-3-glycerol phosphate synthase